MDGNNSKELAKKSFIRRPIFLCDGANVLLVRDFLIQYYSIYDSHTRAPLISAYHPDAMFSMTLSSPFNISSTRLDSYVSFDGDVRGSNDLTRMRHLRVGPNAIVEQLEKWPKTEHLPDSFTVDVMLQTPFFIVLNITGMFKEYVDLPSTSREPYYECRHFMRHFVVVRFDNGYCIRNDLLYIAAATPEQKSAFERLLEQRRGSGDAGANTPGPCRKPIFSLD